MRRLITITLLSALFGRPAVIAQTVDSPRSSAVSSSPAMSSPPMIGNMQMAGGAPIGHRQPHLRDVPSENPDSLGHLSPEDVAVDRKLIICRGC